MIKRNISALLAALMIVSLFLSGCSFVAVDKPINGETEEITLGEGENQFLLEVTDDKGNESAFRISTEKETVGDALVDLKIIEGEQGPYGMYIKTVNGLTVDFNDGGKYWAFYVNEEYATSGVDATPIENGCTYSLKVQK